MESTPTKPQASGNSDANMLSEDQNADQATGDTSGGTPALRNERLLDGPTRSGMRQQGFRTPFRFQV
jgi:hypothetical protein